MTGQNQADFAAAVGVSRSAVANWETGNGVPDMPNMIRIAEHSGMGFEYLVTGRNEQRFAPQLVLAWRRLDERKRAALLTLVGDG